MRGENECLTSLFWHNRFLFYSFCFPSAFIFCSVIAHKPFSFLPPQGYPEQVTKRWKRRCRFDSHTLNFQFVSHLSADSRRHREGDESLIRLKFFRALVLLNVFFLLSRLSVSGKWFPLSSRTKQTIQMPLLRDHRYSVTPAPCLRVTEYSTRREQQKGLSTQSSFQVTRFRGALGNKTFINLFLQLQNWFQWKFSFKKRLDGWLTLPLSNVLTGLWVRLVRNRVSLCRSPSGNVSHSTLGKKQKKHAGYCVSFCLVLNLFIWAIFSPFELKCMFFIWYCSIQ